MVYRFRFRETETCFPETETRLLETSVIREHDWKRLTETAQYIKETVGPPFNIIFGLQCMTSEQHVIYERLVIRP